MIYSGDPLLDLVERLRWRAYFAGCITGFLTAMLIALAVGLARA